jgi:opacity protein-like surface antigen
VLSCHRGLRKFQISGVHETGSTSSFAYTAGFGLEWAFAGNWSLRVEYDYIGLPSQSYTVAAGTSTFGGDVITFSDRNLSIATGAINYKFGGW